ncbi:hypothetical protein AM352_14450 [Citrobacter koseri]|nr:hypothetical protein AM352_14450 [Citrobacter koseri]AYY76487.1 hypothetical protein EGX86_16215 [Citrobacter koseri]PWY12698.1 hypothetical protein DL345_17005 [Citrobacter koseri]PYZ80949.1 hypothetical protein DNK65_10250 [Citrobacter koseri]RZA61479.1 hypothetical protein EVX99_15925 [Citrobacter koseri]
MTLFSAIPWSIPIPITSYLLIAGGGRGSRSRGVGLYSTVKNHIFFVDKAYSLRGMIIFSRE